MDCSVVCFQVAIAVGDIEFLLFFFPSFFILAGGESEVPSYWIPPETKQTFPPLRGRKKKKSKQSQ